MIGWLIGGLVLLLLVTFWFIGRRSMVTPDQARRQFLEQREHLEASFFQAASASGKPRGLRWKNCDWNQLLVFSQDRQANRLTAIAGVTISFEAIEGGDMEGVAAVGNLRNASALFVHDGRRWIATGRALFNLNPEEVVARFPAQFVGVDELSQLGLGLMNIRKRILDDGNLKGDDLA